MVRLSVRVRVWLGFVRIRDGVGGRVGLRLGCGLGFELVRVGVKVGLLRVKVMVRA